MGELITEMSNYKRFFFSESDWELLQIFVFLELAASRFDLTSQQKEQHHAAGRVWNNKAI